MQVLAALVSRAEGTDSSKGSIPARHISKLENVHRTDAYSITDPCICTLLSLCPTTGAQ